MARRLLIGFFLACTLLLAGTATGDPGISERKVAVDSKIDRLQGRIDAARQREGVLSSQIAVVTAKIRSLQGDVDVASAKLDGLESVLALHQRKLDGLNQLYRLQTRKLVFLQHQYQAAAERLNQRLVEIYTADATEPLTVVLEAASFGDMLDQLEFLNDIGSQDAKIAHEVERAKIQVRETRDATRNTRNEVAVTTRAVAARTLEQRHVRDRLAWSQRQLATARREKSETLDSVQEQKDQYIAEVDGLRTQSLALADKIRASQAAAPTPSTGSGGAPSAAGLIWPIQGTLTSPFGPRWGRIHEGIDIGAPTGTPIVAAASGTVIVSGWSGGYGNLLVIDHGNGMATAYAHNSSLVAGVGQQVAQGQLVAYAGNTGHSFGSHLHFEVRINGSPVDPLGYL